MNQFVNRSRAATASVDVDQGLRSYMISVYNYMAGALGLTGIVAFAVAQSPELMQTLFGTPLKWVVMLAPLGIVLLFGSRIMSMSQQGAQAVFWGFAATMGLSLATIFVVYTDASIARAFFITAATFGSVSLYGYTTKKDLSGWGSFLFMGLIGIVIASVVNMFLQSSGLQFAVSILGVLIFTGLTAYDTQRIKQTYYQIGSDQVAKASIMGALSLYMDFINLFMMLLRFVGDRR